MKIVVDRPLGSVPVCVKHVQKDPIYPDVAQCIILLVLVNSVFHVQIYNIGLTVVLILEVIVNLVPIALLGNTAYLVLKTP